MLDRDAAQRRVNQIRAFHAELEALRAAGAPSMTDEQRAALRAYHDELLARLTADFDIDRNEAASQLSRGMRLASFFAAVTLTAAVYSLVSRYWGRLDLPLQSTLLAACPLMALVGVEVSALRERTLYVASLFAVVAYGTYWLAVVVLSETLNIPIAPPWIWGGALFGMALALPYRFRLVLTVGLVSLVFAIGGSIFQAAGYPWTGLFEHADILTLTAFALMVIAPRLEQLDQSFATVTRLVSFGVGLSGLLLMSTFGAASLLPFSRSTIEFTYQAAMLIVSVALLVIGIRRHWNETVYIAAIALTLFLLGRFIDWFWSVLPGYVFFLILATIAFAWLLVLRRIRARVASRRGLP
jgi:hypothetical protein